MWSILSLSQRSAHRKVPWVRLSLPGWSLCRGTFGGQSLVSALVGTKSPSYVTLPSDSDIWVRMARSSPANPISTIIICTHMGFFVWADLEGTVMACQLPVPKSGTSSFVALAVRGWNLSSRKSASRPISPSMLPSLPQVITGRSGFWIIQQDQGVITTQEWPIVREVQHPFPSIL